MRSRRSRSRRNHRPKKRPYWLRRALPKQDIRAIWITLLIVGTVALWQWATG